MCVKRGKSRLHQAECPLVAGQGDLMTSAAEKITPLIFMSGKCEMVR